MKNHTNRGFTIVEVLFVLAIGGLVLTMVFYAIPAITRWNTNNKRKADVSAILQAVSDYRLQNMGSFPPSNSTLEDLRMNGKTRIYENISINSDADQKFDYVKNINEVKIYNYAKCPSDNTAKTVLAGSRDIVALYALDIGQGNDEGQPLCKEL